MCAVVCCVRAISGLCLVAVRVYMFCRCEFGLTSNSLGVFDLGGISNRLEGVKEGWWFAGDIYGVW